MHQRLKAELHHTAEEFLRIQQSNGDAVAGGITVVGPSYFKVRLVDKDFKPHSFTVTVQENK